MKQILAFHGKESLKQETITRIKEHVRLGQLVQGRRVPDGIVDQIPDDDLDGVHGASKRVPLVEFDREVQFVIQDRPVGPIKTMLHDRNDRHLLRLFQNFDGIAPADQQQRLDQPLHLPADGQQFPKRIHRALLVGPLDRDLRGSS